MSTSKFEYQKYGGHNNQHCSVADCLNDVMARVQGELRSDERIWLMERNRAGRWGVSVVRDRAYESIQAEIEAETRDLQERGVEGDKRYSHYPEEVVTIAYGSGNTMYQALNNLWLEVKLYHRDGTTTGRRPTQKRRKKATD